MGFFVVDVGRPAWQRVIWNANGIVIDSWHGEEVAMSILNDCECCAKRQTLSAFSAIVIVIDLDGKILAPFATMSDPLPRLVTHCGTAFVRGS